MAKRRMAKEKSKTCMNKWGRPLAVYRTYRDAVSAARSIRMRSGNRAGEIMYPTRCAACGLYHLSPLNGQYKCDCIDSSGNAKRCYPTREDALRAKEARERDRSKTLRIYECPQGRGFHLTHVKARAIPARDGGSRRNGRRPGEKGGARRGTETKRNEQRRRTYLSDLARLQALVFGGAVNQACCAGSKTTAGTRAGALSPVVPYANGTINNRTGRNP